MRNGVKCAKALSNSAELSTIDPGNVAIWWRFCSTCALVMPSGIPRGNKQKRRSRPQFAARGKGAPPILTDEQKSVVLKALAIGAGKVSFYSEELGDEIAERISTDLTPIKTLCAEEEHWPAPLTLANWERTHESFSKKMLLARQVRADSMIDEAFQDTTSLNVDTKYGSNRTRRQAMLNGLRSAMAQRNSKLWVKRESHEIDASVETPERADLSGLSNEELRDLVRLQKKARGVNS